MLAVVCGSRYNSRELESHSASERERNTTGKGDSVSDRSNGVSSPSAGELTLESQYDSVSYVLLARALKVSVQTLYEWVKAGRIIQPTYFGNQARWTPSQFFQIQREGTLPAGTYPPVQRPRDKIVLNSATLPPGKTMVAALRDKRNVPTAKPKPQKKCPVKDHRHTHKRKRGER